MMKTKKYKEMVQQRWNKDKKCSVMHYMKSVQMNADIIPDILSSFILRVVIWTHKYCFLILLKKSLWSFWQKPALPPLSALCDFLSIRHLIDKLELFIQAFERPFLVLFYLYVQ